MTLGQLDDSLSEIKTIHELFDYLRLVSAQSRLIQVSVCLPRLFGRDIVWEQILNGISVRGQIL